MAVQTFSCPACRGGEFRSLPGPDGKAFCPWCGVAVTGGTATSAVEAAPAPVPAAPAPPPAADPELRERLTTLQRRSEQAEAELQRELDKKETIKRAVSVEMGRLAAQLAEAREQHARESEAHRSAVADLSRLKAELDESRKRAAELAGAQAAAEAQEKARAALQSELEAARRDARAWQDQLETARHQAEQLKAELARLKASSEAEIKGLWKSVQAGEDKAKALKAESDEKLKALKGADAELRELKPLWEKERAAQRAKEASLRGELEKRDQRIRELQLLIKTLGERLNDLTGRPR